MRNVRTSTQINQRATSVDSSGSTVRDLVINDMNLVRIMLEHFQDILLGNNKTLKVLLFFSEFRNQLFKMGIILLVNSTIKIINDFVSSDECFVTYRS